MAGLGPMAGQNHHFAHYADEKIPYAIDRYVRETGRLYGVLNKRLADREFIAGDYGIADMACYPWIIPERQGQDIDDFPHLKRWREAIRARPAVQRAYALAKIDQRAPAVDDDAVAADPVRTGPEHGALSAAHRATCACAISAGQSAAADARDDAEPSVALRRSTTAISPSAR